jgi:hypothetical protein
MLLDNYCSVVPYQIKMIRYQPSSVLLRPTVAHHSIPSFNGGDAYALPQVGQTGRIPHGIASSLFGASHTPPDGKSPNEHLHVLNHEAIE